MSKKPRYFPAVFVYEEETDTTLERSLSAEHTHTGGKIPASRSNTCSGPVQAGCAHVWPFKGKEGLLHSVGPDALRTPSKGAMQE